MEKPLDALVDNIIIINLDRHSDRYHRAQLEVAKISSIIPRRLSATDGSQLTESEIRRHTNPNYPVQRSRGIIGCGLSHQRAWRMVIEENLGRTLILEDDIIITHSAIDTLRKLASNREELQTYQHYLNWVDILYFGCFGLAIPPAQMSWRQRLLQFSSKYQWRNRIYPYPPTLPSQTHRDVSKSSQVTLPYFVPDFPAGLYSYLVTPSGAHHLDVLLRRDRIMTHIDLQLNYYRSELHLLAIYPKPFQQNFSHNESDIAPQQYVWLNRLVGETMTEEEIPLGWRATQEIHGISLWTWAFAVLTVILGWPVTLVWLITVIYDRIYTGTTIPNRETTICVCSALLIWKLRQI